MLAAFRKAQFTYRFVAQHPLTRRHKLAAMTRYTRWQIVSRLRGGKIVVPFIGNTKLSVRRSMTGATGNIYVGLHEFRDMALVLHLLRGGDTFFDVGANVGTYTVLAAGVAGATVFAFEPSAATFAHLADNIAVNGLENRVTAVRTAVGRERGTVRFTEGHDTVNHVVAAGEGGVDVDLRPLDDFADHAPLAIKVDVEGFEDAVLAGADRLLQSPTLRVILIEANQSGSRYGTSDQGVHDTLRRHGFFLCDYDPFRRTLTPAEDQRPGYEYNGLYVRDPEFVRDRLARAEPFVVLNQRV